MLFTELIESFSDYKAIGICGELEESGDSNSRWVWWQYFFVVTVGTMGCDFAIMGEIFYIMYCFYPENFQ